MQKQLTELDEELVRRLEELAPPAPAAPEAPAPAPKRKAGCSVFSLYDDVVRLPSADRYFPGGCAGQMIKQTLRAPRSALDAWWLVSWTAPGESGRL